MKAFIVLLAILVSQSAHAGWSCRDKAGTAKVDVSESPKGPLVKSSSEEITAYYQKFKISIKTLESVIDPETLIPVSETAGNTVLFMVSAPNSGTETVWSLEFALHPENLSATAVVTDQEGKNFSFALACKPRANR